MCVCVRWRVFWIRHTVDLSLEYVGHSRSYWNRIYLKRTVVPSILNETHIDHCELGAGGCRNGLRLRRASAPRSRLFPLFWRKKRRDFPLSLSLSWKQLSLSLSSSDARATRSWDAEMMRGCDCASEYAGHDCSLFTCPVGDDPMTTGQINEVQMVKSSRCGNIRVGCRLSVTRL